MKEQTEFEKEVDEAFKVWRKSRVTPDSYSAFLAGVAWLIGKQIEQEVPVAQLDRASTS